MTSPNHFPSGNFMRVKMRFRPPSLPVADVSAHDTDLGLG